MFLRRPSPPASPSFSVVAGSLSGPRRYNRAKLDAYECGIEPTPQPIGGGRFPVKYYLTAMLFIVFDIEIVFLYPWAVALRPARACSGSSRWSCSSSPSSSPTPTSGVAAGSSGTDGRTERRMGLEEKLPSGVLLTTVEKLAGYARKASLWPATFGLACCAIEMMATGGRPLRPRPLRHGGLPRLAAAGRPDDRRRPGQPEDGPGAAPDLRPDARAQVGARDGRLRQLAAACSTTTRSSRASTTSCPVDMYLPGCPPRPEMLIDAILKLHDKIQDTKLGVQPRARDRRARGGRPERHRRRSR